MNKIECASLILKKRFTKQYEISTANIIITLPTKKYNKRVLNREMIKVDGTR